MKKDFIVLLTILATVPQLVFASAKATQEPVNKFNAPVLLQGVHVNYQQQDIKQQQSLQQTLAQPEQSVVSASQITTKVFPDTPTLNSVFESFGLGQGIGVNGLLSGDYNSDGIPELVLASPSSIVFGEGEQGQFSLQSQLQFPSQIGRLEYFRDLSTDGHFAFFSLDNNIQKLDLLTRKVIAASNIGNITSYRLLNSATQQSTVLLASTYSGHMHIIDPQTMQSIASQAGFAATIAAVGAFTDTNSTQILLSNGQIYTFDSNTFTLQKTLMLANHAFSYAVDIDGDGLDEILAAEGWYTIKLYSPMTEEVIWTKQSDLDIDALILADVDQDGKLDAVYGDGQWGNLYAFDLQTGDDFWSINNPEHGVTNIVIADLDNDGSLDIGWGAGYSSSGADYFFIHDLTSKELKWQSEDIGFPISAIALVDVDQDGDLDAVTASLSSDSGYSGGVIQAFDIQSKTRLWRESAANNWGSTMKLLAADLDNDGKSELIIGSSEIYSGMVRVLNAQDGSERFKKFVGDGDNVSGLTVADLDDDGFREIIIGNGAEHTGSEGVFFTVLDGRTGELKQRSPSLEFSWQGLTDLHAVEVDGSQFVYGLLGNNLHQYNYSNNTVKQLTATAQYQQLAKVMVEGVTRLAVSDNSGKLILLSTDAAVITTKTLCSTKITGLSASAPDSVFYSCQDSIGEYNLLTENDNFNQATGFVTAGDPLAVRHNGKDQYMVGGSKVAVYHAEAPATLATPDPVSLSTHVLQAVEGTLQMADEVDYFVLTSSTKAGQLSFTNRKTGEFLYQPAGSSGTETLKYYAVKGNAVSPEADLTIELTNSEPVANNQNISTHWNNAVQIILTAQDDDDEPLQFELKSEPQHGQIMLLDPTLGTVEYTPSGTSLDTVSFSFTAKDSLITSGQKNVVITLTNTAPVGTPKTYTTSYMTPVQGGLTGTDADDDEISYEITAQPTAGSLTLNSDNGLFVYTPSGDTDQTVSFSFVVKDKFASSTAQTVTINVKGAAKESGSGGGTFSIFSMLALLLLTIRRRRQPS